MDSHEGTNQVTKFKITLLFAEDDAFKMKENELVQQMISRLTSLVNDLSSL